MSFRAKYPGDCRNCDEGIVRGQEVEYDDDRNLVHVLCPEDGINGAPLPVCPYCFCQYHPSVGCDCRD